MHKYFNILYKNWSKIIAEDSRTRNQVTILLFFYIFLFKFFRVIMTELESRQGTLINDPFLSWLPAHDFSGITLLLTYAALAIFLVSNIIKPGTFIIGLQAYCLLLIMRALSIFLVPLEPPADMILLRDPITILFMSKPDGSYIVKDLFFSGHISAIVLFFLVSKNATAKLVLLFLGILVSSLLLIQHVHYTIDIAAAPFFSLLAYKISLYLDKLVHPNNYVPIPVKL